MSSKSAAIGMYSNILKKDRILTVAAKLKTPRQLERHVKGVSNHWRISILMLVATRQGLTLDDITRSLNGNFKTISVHTQRLTQAGLLNKKYSGNHVEHSLTPYGRKFYTFLKSF